MPDAPPSSFPRRRESSEASQVTPAANYEQGRYPMPAEMTALEALLFFMERDGLCQKDLPEIGNQAKVSEILAGHRALNLRQSRALAARFGVPVRMFVV